MNPVLQLIIRSGHGQKGGELRRRWWSEEVKIYLWD